MKVLSLNAIVVLLSVEDISPANAFVSHSVTTASPKCHGSMILQESKVSEPPTEKKSNDAGKEVLEDLFCREADAIFDSIDVNSDGEISNDELQSYLEKKGYASDSIRMLFTAVDKNADGAISREEMRYAFSNYEMSALYRAFGLGNELGSNEKDSEEKDYDDAVSKIRLEALSNWHTYTPEMLTKLADMIFDMIDVDGSGEIDASELRMHFADADKGSTSTCFREDGQATIASGDSILKALDINSDGVISREEMRSGFKQYDPRTLSSALGFHVAPQAEV